MLNEQEKKLFEVASSNLRQLATGYKELQTKYAEMEKREAVEKVAEQLIESGKADINAKESLIEKIASEDDLAVWEKVAALEPGDMGMSVGETTMSKEAGMDPLTQAVLGLGKYK